MFLGHYAVALAAKKAAPELRLGELVLAAQTLDTLWPIFLALGIEHVSLERGATRVTPFNFYYYPLSHCLLMALVWALVLGAGYVLFTRAELRNTRTAFLVLAGCVVSHWILDWVSHRPDLPFWPGNSPYVGLRLWDHPAASAAVEFGGFLAALAVYRRVARDLIRPAVFWSWVGLLLLIGVSVYTGQAPSDVKPVEISAFAMWLLIVWAYWAERKSRANVTLTATAYLFYSGYAQMSL